MAWSRVQEAALSYREMLKGMGLESFVKTTGGKGLHIVVPLLPKYGWDEIKAFAKYMAEEMVRREPNGFTSSIAKKARGGKIFVDYLRNQRGATAIAAYSSRAKDGAPVSVPISWREVEVGIRSDQFTVTSLPGRLAALKADPWAGISGVKQSLSAAVRRKLRA
jgi:bifunctional non-homologous end joining protein LigD